MYDEQIAALVVGITEIVKNAGLPSRYCPFFAVGLGIIIKLAETWSTGSYDYFGSALRGAMIGLATTGVYSAIDGFVKKSTVKNTHGNLAEETH